MNSVKEGKALAQAAQAEGEAVAQTAQAEGEAVAQAAQAEGEAVAQTAQAEGEAVAQTAQAEGEALARAAQAEGEALARAAQAEGEALTQATQAEGKALAQVTQAEGKTPASEAGASFARGVQEKGLQKQIDENENGHTECEFLDKRWFDRIPLPEVEPVDKGFLYDLEGNERCQALDGLRLATLSAIRDQETAISRELQCGDAEIARLTAECLAEMNQMVAGLEEVLCSTVDDIPELYEDQGPQKHDINLRTITPTEGADLLQAKVIPVAEVCENIGLWKEAIGEEVASVINKHKAGTFKTEQEVKQLEASNDFQVIRVPGKLVAAIKPPRRYKARLVACGNFLHREKTRKSATLDRTDLYCSNLDIFSLRIQLATGVARGWKAASIDVKTAFLTAPYQAGRSKGPNAKQKIIMVKVPRAVTLAGFAPHNSYIQVDKALYGLQESPHSWSIDRDRKLSQTHWQCADGSVCRFVQCETDSCIWKIIDDKRKIKGTLGVYVDDLLFMACPEELEAAITAVRGVWECSATTYAEDVGGMGFCGIQIVQKGSELWIHQEKYVEELKTRYPSLQPSAYLPDFKDLPEKEEVTPEGVRRAQKVIGELQWLAGRTRPDIAYCVNRMSRLTTVVPDFVQRCGNQVIRFLIGTARLRIKYGKAPECPSEFSEALPMTRSAQLLETFCDASFAQQDSCSQTGVTILLNGQLLGWLSLRQPFITLSTAEAEVVSCVEGVALAQALRPLVEELSCQETTWLLINDNIACGAILSYPAGSWRSRHLRLRSKALQEMISEEVMSVHHVQGRYMVAGLLTKPLAPSRVFELLEFMNCDTAGINLGRKERITKGCDGVSSAVRVILLSMLAVPAKAQGEDDVHRARDAQSLLYWFMLAVVIVVMVLWVRWDKQGRLRKLRQRAGELCLRPESMHRGLEIEVGSSNPSAQETRATAVPQAMDPKEVRSSNPSAHETRAIAVPKAMDPKEKGSSDPNAHETRAKAVPEALTPVGIGENIDHSNSRSHEACAERQPELAAPSAYVVEGMQSWQALEFSHLLWYLWSLQGSVILGFVGLHAPEVMCLREVAKNARLRVATSYAILRPPPGAEIVESADEETDSGLSVDVSSATQDNFPWEPIHELLRPNPMYREHRPLRMRLRYG